MAAMRARTEQPTLARWLRLVGIGMLWLIGGVVLFTLACILWLLMWSSLGGGW